jgi:hypothetical protein
MNDSFAIQVSKQKKGKRRDRPRPVVLNLEDLQRQAAEGLQRTMTMDEFQRLATDGEHVEYENRDEMDSPPFTFGARNREYFNDELIEIPFRYISRCFVYYYIVTASCGSCHIYSACVWKVRFHNIITAKYFLGWKNPKCLPTGVQIICRYFRHACRLFGHESASHS